MLLSKNRLPFQCSTPAKLCKRFTRNYSSSGLIDPTGHGPKGHEPTSSSLLDDIEQTNFRKKFAPWLSIGHYEAELMAHLKTKELFRAASVLYMCRFDRFVEKSQELFNLSRKFGMAWVVRHTFFEQFVAGDTLDKMEKSMELMHRRGLLLMLLPVLEADVSEVLDQSQCDRNLDTLEGLIRLTAKLEPINPTFHLKVSAIIPTNTLKNVSSVLIKYKNSSDKEGLLSSQARLIEIFSNSIERSESLDEVKGLTARDRDNIIRGLRRANKLGNLAREMRVQILVDAEFVSCKEAISLVAHCLMARFNTAAPLVGNTTQAYLKGALTTASNEWDLMQNVLGVHWGGKVVRGAYMVRENEIARQLGQPSPIWSSYEQTNRSYNATIAHILERMGTNQEGRCKASHLIVATHNERSIRLAAHLIKKLGLDSTLRTSNSGHLVSFAQIYGMADYLSTPLVRNGHPVYKSTPYGPMESVLPYLSRRAIENRSVIQGARLELEMLTKEIKSRIPIIRNL